MINTPVILTTDINILESKAKLDSGEIIYAILCEDIASIEKLTPTAIHRNKIIPNSNCYFSIYFDFTKDVHDLQQHLIHFKEMIMQCLFHPKYKIVHNRPLICLNTADAKKTSVQKVISELSNYVVSQGYNSILFIYFSEKELQPDNNINFTNAVSLETISSEYAYLVSKKYYCSKYIGIGHEDAERTIHKLVEIEKELEKNNPDQFNQLKELQELKQQVLALNEKIDITEKELTNQKEYLKIFKDLDESTKIIRFYKYEYEILPLWYKKIGHVLKVFMGKRTFRSLFDNDVKKYNE